LTQSPTYFSSSLPSQNKHVGHIWTYLSSYLNQRKPGSS
jgi:hypothetical protein